MSALDFLKLIREKHHPEFSCVDLIGKRWMCNQEIAVPGSLEKCIRILVLFNTEKRAEDIRHVYINGAEVLRNAPQDRGRQT